MKKILYLTLFLFVHIATAQTDEDYSASLEQIAEGYNAKDSSKIFNLFSDELKNTFTLDKVKTFIDENYENKGTMGSTTYLSDDDQSKSYLVEFENISSIIIISLTTDKKISVLSIEEY